MPEPVDEKIDPLRGEDPADVMSEKPLVGRETARVVAGDPSDGVGQARRAMDREGAVSVRAPSERANERTEPGDGFPGEHVDLVAARDQPLDQMPLALTLHQRPRQVRDPQDLHGAGLGAGRRR